MSLHSTNKHKRLFLHESTFTDSTKYNEKIYYLIESVETKNEEISSVVCNFMIGVKDFVVNGNKPEPYLVSFNKPHIPKDILDSAKVYLSL